VGETAPTLLTEVDTMVMIQIVPVTNVRGWPDPVPLELVYFNPRRRLQVSRLGFSFAKNFEKLTNPLDVLASFGVDAERVAFVHKHWDV